MRDTSLPEAKTNMIERYQSLWTRVIQLRQRAVEGATSGTPGGPASKHANKLVNLSGVDRNTPVESVAQPHFAFDRAGVVAFY